MSEPVETILAALPGARPCGSNRWSARCPAHEDRRPSLSISRGDDGRALLHCFSGCTVGAIVAALDLTMRDLMPDSPFQQNKTPRRSAPAGVLSIVGPSDNRRRYPTARAAVQALERWRGRRSAMWTYHDAAGMPVGVILRWDRGADKDVLPVSRIGEAWVCCAMPLLRPLYGLPQLLRLSPGSQVVVTEGEKAADAARNAGYIATTSPHGARSGAKADWSPLAGMHIIISPDNDSAGEEYVESVIQLLECLWPLPRVRVVRLPGLPKGGDFADFLAMRRAS